MPTRTINIQKDAAVIVALCMFVISACKKDDPAPPTPVSDGLTNHGWTRKAHSTPQVLLGSGPSSLHAIRWETNANGIFPATSYSSSYMITSDMGDTWTTSSLLSGSVGADEFVLFGSPRFVDEQVGYFACLHGSIWSPTTSWYRSINGGQSWSAAGNGGGNGGGFARAGATSRLFRYGDTQTYMSENLGTSWSSASAALGQIKGMVFTDDQHGFATGVAGILTTTDGGTSWQSVSDEGFSLIAQDDALVGIATRGPLVGPGELFRTTDGWETSELVQTPAEVGAPKCILLDGLGRLYACKEERLYVSTDLGETWSLDLEMPADNNITWIRRVDDHLVVATISSSWARKFAPL